MEFKAPCASATILFRPKDTRVILRQESTETNKDLRPLFTDYHQGYMKLEPVQPQKWISRIKQDKNGINCLRHLHAEQSGEITGRKCFIQFACDWPDQASDFITRKKIQDWPNADQIQRVVENSCGVTPKIKRVPNVYDENKDLEWKFSFAVGMKMIALEAVTPAQRKVFQTMRLFMQNHLHNIRQRIGDTHLKCLFFYACECIPENEWASQPMQCILYMVQTALEQLKAGHFAHYFIKDRNLIEAMSSNTVEEHIDRLDMLRRQAMIFVYFILDQHKITQSCIGLMIDLAIEDLSHPVEGEVLVGETGADRNLKLACEGYILMRQFAKALQICISSYEKDACSRNSALTFSGLLVSILVNLPIEYRWSFAFYTDRHTGTTTLDTLLQGNKTVPASRFFGTEVVQVFGLTDDALKIPETMARDIRKVLPLVDIFSDLLYFEFRYGETMVHILQHFLREHGGTVLAVTDKSDHRVVLENSARKVPGRRTPLKYMLLFYEKLFTVCESRNAMELLDDLMDVYEDVCDKLADAAEYLELASRWEKLGNKHRQQLVVSKAQSLFDSF